FNSISKIILGLFPTMTSTIRSPQVAGKGLPVRSAQFFPIVRKNAADESTSGLFSFRAFQR
ncbi:MAG: hypothetical protein ACK5TX_21860, partial [Planctomyces sp.]